MQDCMNRDQMELASASLSSAAPAPKHRSSVAALIAAVIVAAALLFTMPSLAYASNEASGNSQSTESQEILLSSSDSSTSVNKAPDEPKAPPAYTAQDAYESTPQSTDSGVDVVNGAGDSSYTPGDDKSSTNDKDSDSDSDSDSNSGIEDTDDSTLNKGDDTSDSNTDNGSTGDSTGASSGSTDEIATDNNQSANPTGSDSKADDVIATPGDKGSADLTAGATSDNSGEVKQQTVSDSITPQAAGATITIHFNSGFSVNSTHNLGTSVTPDISYGNADDPIFSSDGSWLCFGEDALTTTDVTADESKFLGLKRIGYGFSKWVMTVKIANGTYQLVSGTTSIAGFKTQINNANFSDYHIWAIWSESAAITVTFRDTATVAYGAPYTSDKNYMTALSIPERRDTSKNTAFYGYINDSLRSYTALKEGDTVSDILDQIYHFRGNSTMTYSNIFSSYFIQEFEIVDENAITVTYDGNKPAAATGTVSGVPANGSGSKDGNTPFVIDSAIPTLAGYKFNGWNTAANGGGTSYAAGATIPAAQVTGDITLYAQWVQQVSITFNDARPSGVTATISNKPSTITVDAGTATAIPTDIPTMDGYTFKNWTTNADGTGTVYTPGQAIASLTASLALYTQWTKNPTVTYNANGGLTGTMPSAETVVPGVYSIKTGEPTRTNYVFGGWTTVANNTSGGLYSYNGTITGSQRSLNVTSDVTLYALWNPTVTYTANTPSGAKDSVTNMPSTTTYTVAYNGTHTVLTTPIPTVTGYTFGGWATSATSKTAVTTLPNVTEATTLYAIWNENNNYVVQFFDQSTGTADGTVYASQTGISWTGAVNLPTVPTKLGYTFSGWYLQKDNQGSGTGTAFSNATGTTKLLQNFNDIWAAYPAASRADTLKIYAKWTEKTKVSVTLNPNGGSYGTAGTGVTTVSGILNGATYTIPTNVDNPTRTGYNFKEWNTNSTGTGKAYYAGSTTDALTANLTLYAIWEGAPVTFTFEKGATTGVTAKKGDPYTTTANYGAKLTADAGDSVYTRTGYTFKNWYYTNATGGTSTVSTATAAGQVDVSNFTISWSGNSFDGTLRGTATLTADWDPYTFTISWNADGGTPTTSTSGHKSTDVVSIPTASSAIPTRPGYTFTGWRTGQNGAGVEVNNSKTIENTWSLTGLANNATLVAYAQWKENIVELTFVGHKDKNNAITANVAYNDNNGAVPSTIYVGAATGAIYSSASATTPTSYNISRKVKPSIVDTNYEFLKWQKDGADMSSSSYTSAGVLTIPTNVQGLYETATYSLIMGPKQYGYTVEYFLQDVTGSGYTKDDSLTVTSGTAPFGYRVESGTSASVSDTSSLVTFVRKTLTGFTYNAGVTGTKGFIVSVGSDATQNIIQLYYTRNSANLNISYAGAVPPGMSYTPASQTVRYDTEVTLTTPTAPTGYVFDGWTVTSGSLQSGENLNIPTGGNASFHMPDNALVIRGNWSKETYTAVFKLSNGADGTNVGNLSGTSTFTVSYGDTITTSPTASPKDSTKYYFIGWNVYTGCTGSNESTGTLVGTLQNADIDGTFVIESNTVFVGRFGELIGVSYVAGANGAFTEVNGNMQGGTVTNAGTVYENLQATWNLPGFAYGDGKVNVSSFDDPNGGRNLGPTGSANPKAKPGYKFVGWSWVGANGTTYENTGYYDNYQFVKTSGSDMPIYADASYIFTAKWEKTWQQVHFSDQCANISGLTGTGATDAKYQIGDRVTLPVAPTYHDTDNKGAYTFLGWTTVATGYVAGSSPLYTNAAGRSFTMTAGERDTSLYSSFAEVVADGCYGVTFYPVFSENTATINYTFVTGCSSMGSVTPGSETIGMATGSAAGATATASTGHVFKGWFTDAAGTQAVNAGWLSGTDNNIIKPQQDDGIYAAGPTTYYALFEVEKYTVQFNIGDTTMGGWADGDTNVTKQTANPIPYNTALGSANVPAVKGKTGYGFVAWNTKADGTGTSYTDLSNVKITGPDMVFYAQWEPRDGYTIHYNPNGGVLSTTTQTTVSGGAKLKWTDVLNDVMISDAKNIKKLGYKFDGWYATSDFSSPRIDFTGSTFTFEDGVAQSGQSASADDAITLELYAKWIANDYTMKYNAQLPVGSITIGDKTPVHWDSTNLRPSGNEVLTLDGYDFIGWNTKADGSGMTVSDTTVFSDAYQNVNGTTTDTVDTLTLYGIWKQKAFTVIFRDGATELSKRENLTWDDVISYYNPVTPNGPKRLSGWTYTPQGGTQQTWDNPSTTLGVATIAGNAAVATGSTFYLDAVYEDNAIWIINYNKVNVDASGNPVSSTVTKVSSEDGYIEPGTAIDIRNFNGKDYIATFNTANAATTLKGYALDLNALDTRTTATAAEVLSGQNLVFNIYWVEKIFNFEYDLGVDGQGNPAPSTLTPPDPRSASWTSAVPQPTWPGEIPNWDGHKDPKWQYKSGSTWVDVPAGATVSTIAATDDNSNPIVLRLLWATDQARITYAAQDGGSAAGGSLNVPAKGSAYEDINAVSGTPTTMTATAAAGYKFDGWYNGATLVTNSNTLTVTKNSSGLYETATYTAHFVPLGAISYTIEHYFEQLDGSYAINAGLTDTATGQENSRVDKTSAMEKDVKGYTFTAGITGEKLYIASLQSGSDDNVLRLYYTLNEYVVDVVNRATGADAPVSVPVPVYPTTGITSAHTNHKYGTSLVLPTMPDVNGWDFSWTITYTEPGEATTTRTNLANGATFDMPDADVSIIGVWTRMPHEVTFVAGSDPHGTVSVKAPATLPFYVDHGKKMSDAGSTGNYGLIDYTEDTGWALVGWRYLDADGVEKDTVDPNSVVINANTVFTALWAQTFYVAYDPGSGTANHGGAGFTTLQNGGTEIGLGRNVNEFPLLIGGADRTENAPAAAGYQFIGWTWNNGGNFYWITDAAKAAGFDTTGLGTEAAMDFMVERNITFTAIWEAIEQTLTYKIDGDNSPASNWTTIGTPGAAGLTTEDYVANPKPRTDSVVTLLTDHDVQRAGYTLAGWKYTDNNGVEHTINGSFTMPAYSVTLTPVWDFAGIKIYFDYANGCDNSFGQLDKFSVSINDATAMHIDGATATANKGYKFMGWYTDASHTVAVDAFSLEGSSGEHFIGDGTNGWVSKTYYAWFDAAETTYVIEFNLQTVDGFNTITRTFGGVTTGSTVDAETAGNKAYTDRLSVEAEDAFKAYVFDPSHPGSELIQIVMADGTTKLVLFYNLLPFNITYDKDDPNAAYTWDWVSTVGPDKATAGSEVTIPSATRDGWEFAGWTITYTDPTDGQVKTVDLAGSTFTMPLADVLVTAKWAQYMDVVIEYYKRGEVDPLGTETAPALEGTTFEVSLDRIAAFKAAHLSELNGYRYVDDGKRSIVVTSDPRHNVIQIFFDLINDFGVQFDKNYGDGNRIIGSIEDLNLGDMPYSSRPADPTRPGYILDTTKTWNTKADGTGMTLELTTTLEDLLRDVYGDNFSADDFLNAGGILTLYAIWNENDQFEVKYELNNTMEKNPNILRDMPEWRDDMEVADVKGALWNKDGFNFVPSDKELSAPHGYEFVGWNTQADGKGHTITDATKYFEMSNWIDPNVEQMSITLYAMWKEIEIEIEYIYTEGGTVDRVIDKVSAVTGQHVSTGSSPVDPTPRLHSVATAKPGYHFVGWELYDEEKHGSMIRAMSAEVSGNLYHFLRNDNSEIVIEEPGEDGRLYAAKYIAIFEKNDDATITYDPNGGEGDIPSTTTSHGLTVNLHNGTGVKRPYYTLVSWNTEADGSGETYRLGQDLVMPEGGLHLYAMWEINSYPVHVGDRNDDVADVKGGNIDVVYGEKLSPEFIAGITQTPKKGSTFKGWHVTMTDGETGEVVFDQIVWDLSEIPEIVGPVEITAEYETMEIPAEEEDLVTDGTVLPKTGDDVNGLFGWILALLAGLALALGLVFGIARRRRDDDDPEDGPSGNGHGCGYAYGRAYVYDRTYDHGKGSMLSFRMRNGCVRNIAYADGIAHTAKVTRTSSVDCAAKNFSRMQLRAFFIAVFFALILASAVVFAPGIALATTGDPGTGSTSTTSSYTQTNHSNADPATSQTGSFQSSGKSYAASSTKVSTQASTVKKSAAASTKSTTSASLSSNSGGAASNSSATANKSGVNSSSALSSASNSGGRASQNVSTASCAASSNVSTSASASLSTRIASADKIAHLTYLNNLAHKSSSYSTSYSASSAVSSQSSKASASFAGVSAASTTGTADATDTTGTTGTGTTGAGITGVKGIVLNATDFEETPDKTVDSTLLYSNDKVVYITYRADEGGTVSCTLDKICSLSGTKPDENGIPTDQDITGSVAIPSIGYHFVSWVIEDLDAADLVTVSDKAFLDTKTVKDYSLSDKTNCYEPVSFISLFKSNDYVLDYDANGGQLGDEDFTPSLTTTTFGADDLLQTDASPAKDGHEFICWNTDASGMGVAIREGETLSTDKLRAMVLESPIEDGNGAAIRLYAQWDSTDSTPVILDPSTPDEPVQPVTPVTPVSPGSSAGSGTHANTGQSSSPSSGALASGQGQAVQGALAAADFATVSREADPSQEDASAALAESIEAVDGAVVLPPALEVLPAAADQFVTMSTEALSGVSRGDEGFAGVITSTGVVQAAGTVAAAAGVIAIAIGVASAGSSAAARRRILRTLESELAEKTE